MRKIIFTLLLLTTLSCLKSEDVIVEEIVVELNLGDLHQGGRIFFIDASGKHGLIASEKDLTFNGGDSFFWGDNSLIGASNVTNGKQNTALMVANVLNSSFAANNFINGYYYNGFKDWYIPSKEELILLKTNQDFVGGFPTDSKDAQYWSSTELSSDQAFALNFRALMGSTVRKGMFAYKIRPIREF